MLKQDISRRTFVGSAAALALMLAGCSREEGSRDVASAGSAVNVDDGASADTAAEPEGDGVSAAETGPVLVAYYSATGTTEGVARVIADALGADTFAITPTDPYTDDDLNYVDPSSRVCVEHADSARSVELEQVTPDDYASYSTVFVGYPIWWAEASWVVDGFVRGNDFTGKTVIPFCTSASSGIGRSDALLAELSGTGAWQDGMRFASGFDADEVTSWVDGLGIGA